MRPRNAAVAGSFVLLALVGLTGVLTETARAGDARAIEGGALRIIDPQGQPAGACPLRHTDVQAGIAGYVGRTTVTQQFHNPTDRKIEAVYTFPLPQDAAVDEMVMTVGDRRIVGQIKPRAEARQVYEAAKQAGHVASLLDQERPNIFTQSIANIEPGAEVTIEIRYVETLKYEDGWFEFVFPMVVGPRFVPGQPTGQTGTGWAPDTTDVPDASKITPPVTPPGTRAGHDISMTVHLDAGMAIQDIESVLHKLNVQRNEESRATIQLADQKTIPNKDFILRYRTATERIEDAVLVHADERGRFVTLVLQPPRRVAPSEAVPKEMIFVIDRSGSQSGFPIGKAKETMRLCIQQMNPHDTFNLLSFGNQVERLFDRPVPNTDANRQAALQYLANLDAGGGTVMLPAIKEALTGPGAQQTRAVISPDQLMNLPADGREVIVRVDYDRIRYFDSGEKLSWPGRLVMMEGSLAIQREDGRKVRLGGDNPPSSVVDKHDIRIHGQWRTMNGERVLVAWKYQVDGEGGPAGRLRIVCFLTDGFVGNDMEIIDAARKNAGQARVFSFGIGNSVNRYLLDGLAHAGRGEVEYVTLDSEAKGAAERFQQRIQSPVLTDISIDWGDLPVSEVYPATYPDLFASKPLMIHGRLDDEAKGTITLRGTTAAGPFERTIEIQPQEAATHHEAVASLWARAKVTHLMNKDLAGLQRGAFPKDLEQQITDLGVTFHLMTQFTSFVAVEEMTVTVGGEPTTVAVPVEMPEGVSYEGVFGEAAGGRRVSFGAMKATGFPSAAPAPASVGRARRLIAPRAMSQPPREAMEMLAQDGADATATTAASQPAAMKISEPLRDLAEKVAKRGRDGNLTVDGLVVRDWRVDVMVWLSDTSDNTLHALKELGFVTSGEGKAVRLIIGSIDVRKLRQLAEMDAVVRVTPVQRR